MLILAHFVDAPVWWVGRAFRHVDAPHPGSTSTARRTCPQLGLPVTASAVFKKSRCLAKPQGSGD